MLERADPLVERRADLIRNRAQEILLDLANRSSRLNAKDRKKRGEAYGRGYGFEHGAVTAR